MTVSTGNNAGTPLVSLRSIHLAFVNVTVKELPCLIPSVLGLEGVLLEVIHMLS